MGDHAMCGINTMFNTGTVMGLCASVLDLATNQNLLLTLLGAVRREQQIIILRKRLKPLSVFMNVEN